MQILFQVSKLKCSFFYERLGGIKDNNIIDKKLIEFASRLSEMISSEPFEITLFVNENDPSPQNFLTYKKINLIFRCFDKPNDGMKTKEENWPITLYFDKHLNKEFLDNLFNTDQYINLGPDECELLDTLVKDNE